MPEETKRRRLSIFDVDQTLVHSYGSLAHAWKTLFEDELSDTNYKKLSRDEKDRLIHLSYSKFADETHPNPEVIQKLNEARTSGTHIVIVSGRHEDILGPTKKLLRRFDIRYDEIMLKPHGIKAYDFKLAKASEISMRIGPNSTEIYDDLDYVLDGVHRLLRGSTELKPYIVRNGTPYPYNPI